MRRLQEAEKLLKWKKKKKLHKMLKKEHSGNKKKNLSARNSKGKGKRKKENEERKRKEDVLRESGRRKRERREGQRGKGNWQGKLLKGLPGKHVKEQLLKLGPEQKGLWFKRHKLKFENVLKGLQFREHKLRHVKELLLRPRRELKKLLLKQGKGQELRQGRKKHVKRLLLPPEPTNQGMKMTLNHSSAWAPVQAVRLGIGRAHRTHLKHSSRASQFLKQPEHQSIQHLTCEKHLPLQILLMI
uniref:Uncharacterized protein n=1 Tax=Opuntia streptacantha TaxID=393608 RepID=A0A7C9B131_OPUST